MWIRGRLCPFPAGIKAIETEVRVSLYPLSFCHPIEMFSVRVAAICASAFGTVALVGCFIVVPMLYSEIQDIWNELDLEMDSFKVGSITE